MCVHLFTTHLPHHAGALYPLELIKTRMQVISDSTGTYRSLTKAFGQVLRNEGVKGLYQGMSPALVGASGSWGGYFYFYEQSKERKLRKLQSTGKGSSLLTADHVRRYLPFKLRFCEQSPHDAYTCNAFTAGVWSRGRCYSGAAVQPRVGGED